MSSSESRLLPGLGPHGGCGQRVLVTPGGSWEPSPLGWQEPGTGSQQSTANTCISTACWMSGCVQKAHQGPLPVQKLLVGTHLCNGSVFQHHDPISLGQDVECVGHENPCLGREGVGVTLLCLTSLPELGGGAGSVLGLSAGRAPLLVFLLPFSTAQQSNRGSPSSGVSKQGDTGFPQTWPVT